MGPLRRWWVPSMALTACVALAGWWGIGVASEGLSNWLTASWAGNAFAQKTLEWVIWAVLLVIKVKVTKYVVLVFMGPLFAEVSASAGAALGEPTKAFSWRQWLDSRPDFSESCQLHLSFRASPGAIGELEAWQVSYADMQPVASPTLHRCLQDVEREVGLHNATANSDALGRAEALFTFLWERKSLCFASATAYTECMKCRC